MNWFMQFFKWLASFFDSTAPTSSRRLQAYVILVVLSIGNVNFYMSCPTWMFHIYVIVIDMLFILLLYGLVTFQQLSELRTGVRVTASESKTATGKEESFEKVVTSVEQPPASDSKAESQ